MPVAFTFPNTGKLLTLLFVPYVAWLTGDSLDAAGYGSLFGADILTYFAKAQVALPFLMDLVGVPHDYFQLYIPTTILTGKFDSLASAMSLLAMALITAAAMGTLHLRSPTGGSSWLAVLDDGVAAAVTGTRRCLAGTVDTSYHQDEVVRNVHLPRGPLRHAARRAASACIHAGRALDPVRERDALRVGFVPGPPAVHLRQRAGELVGLDVEPPRPARERPGRAGGGEFVPIRLRTRFADRDRRKGRVDLVMSMPYVAKLLSQASYSAPYLDGFIGFVA